MLCSVVLLGSGAVLVLRKITRRHKTEELERYYFSPACFWKNIEKNRMA